MFNFLTTFLHAGEHDLTSAHGIYVPTEDLEATISSLSLNSVLWATIIMIVLILIAAQTRDRVPKLKTPLFVAIASIILVVSTLLIGSTIYLNVNSESGGPVHWHAGIETWACGEKIELRDPVGRFSNKIGSPTLHEHNDEFIHLEGVVSKESDASLGKFFHVIGGGITSEFMAVPINDDKVLVYKDGETCANGEVGDVQAYVYTINHASGVYSQAKLDFPQIYKLSGQSLFSRAECIIVEFGPTSPTTDRICDQFKVSESLGEIRLGDGGGAY